ncbi:glycoside hydrolase family 30 protein [Flagellimonas sp. DF-77]
MYSANGQQPASLQFEIFETSAQGNKLTALEPSASAPRAVKFVLKPDEEYQTITGFGGSFTQASSHLLNQLGEANREKIIAAYFGADGARYSLTRTHMNSCDFSTHQYSYAPIAEDTALIHFSIDEDKKAVIPFIKSAMRHSQEGFKIVASPWTAPPWMKDNNNWRGGKLLKAYEPSWALFFAKYIDAYKSEGIDIWGLTVENEPLGNDNNWESMHFSPKEMTDFVETHLGPTLEKQGKADIKILGYDQNREHLGEWVDELFRSEASSKYFDGTAIHWYASTYEVFPEALQYAHRKAPDKHLIQSEACVDAEVPKWKDDAWYWSKEATDWGWDWAPEKDKPLHPKYAPTFRYARDIIGCLNNWVDGWIDWNMVLDRQGGPNWFKNWCVAPVIVDVALDEVYVTPLYYVMAHFSRYIRPGAKRIGFEIEDSSLQVTAAKNPNGELVAVVFNPEAAEKTFVIAAGTVSETVTISAKAIQTIVIN